jgi:hypothetical protein
MSKALQEKGDDMSDTNASDHNQSSALSALGDALDAAAESIGHARADATESAKLAAARVQVGVSSSAYYAAYGLSYGLVFGGVFIKELLPANNPIRRGFEDGANAAFEAADNRRVALQADNADHANKGKQLDTDTGSESNN